MKRLAVCALILCITTFMLFSCSKIVEKLFPAIDVKLPAFQVYLPPVPVVAPNEVLLGTITARFNLDSTIRANTGGAFGASSISTIKVKQITVNVPDADQNNNLSNFETARFTLSSNSTSSPAEIATFLFPDGVLTSSTVTPVSSPESKSHFTGTELTYTLYGKNRRPTTRPLTMLVNVTLSVK